MACNFTAAHCMNDALNQASVQLTAVKKLGSWGQHSKRITNLLLDPAAMGSIPSVPKKFSEEKLSMLLRLINGAA